MWAGICRMTTSSVATRGSSASEPRAVVAGHGDFATGIIAAVQQISGVGHRFRAVSNAALGASALDAVLREAVLALGATVVFTDLPAGSCTIAARRLAHDLPNLAVVTGANLPMLLDYALSGGDGLAAVARAVGKGRDAIVLVPPVNRPDGDRAH